ncbi:MAG: nicotinate (nicotinamide) nucleotide adenylyltransferase [Desulfobacterales bacterium]|nr:nicotinate (nicotinamide) nucleotide adenylyltransferase [Desulfobacterales bacterium]
MKNIAIIGGSFNPITTGHTMMAEIVLKEMPNIDEVWFMPTYKHQFGKHEQYAAQRVKMLKLIETDKIKYFDYEIKNKLLGETHVTFTKLLNDPKYKKKYNFSMVIGSDCAFDFDTKWKKPKILSNIVQFIIIPRQGFDINKYNGILSKPPHIILKNVKTLDISSTIVRNKIKNGEPINGLVPEKIEEFIVQNGLYINE